jgi:hypothetical protein
VAQHVNALANATVALRDRMATLLGAVGGGGGTGGAPIARALTGGASTAAAAALDDRAAPLGALVDESDADPARLEGDDEDLGDELPPAPHLRRRQLLAGGRELSPWDPDLFRIRRSGVIGGGVGGVNTGGASGDGDGDVPGEGYLQRFEGISNRLGRQTAAFMGPHSEYVVCGSDHAAVHVWHTGCGNLAALHNAPHEGPIEALAVSMRGAERVATCSFNLLVCCWLACLLVCFIFVECMWLVVLCSLPVGAAWLSICPRAACVGDAEITGYAKIRKSSE